MRFLQETKANLQTQNDQNRIHLLQLRSLKTHSMKLLPAFQTKILQALPIPILRLTITKILTQEASKHGKPDHHTIETQASDIIRQIQKGEP